ncbi:cytochrome P450 [Kitasatospora sp. NPDC004289]
MTSTTSPTRAVRRITPDTTAEATVEATAEVGAPAVLCFPHAGGSASFFRPWQSLFEGVRVHAVQYPGREDRIADPAPAALTELAEQIAAEVLAGPVRYSVLFGHSMGAYLAFEVTRRLESAGVPVPLLVVSSAAAPGLRPPVPFSSTEDVLAYLEGYEPLSPEIREDAELLELLLGYIKEDLRLVAHYREHVGRTVRARVVAVSGRDDVPGIRAGQSAWREHTSGRFSTVTAEGGHFYLRTAPPVALLAGALGVAARESAFPRVSSTASPASPASPAASGCPMGFGAAAIGPAALAPATVGPDALTDGLTYRQGNPYETWARMREQEPVRWHEPGLFPGFWSLTRYEDIREVLRDAETFSSASGILLRPLAQGQDPGSGRTLALSDPPRHSLLRGAIADRFAPRHLRTLGGFLDVSARAAVGAALAAGQADFVTEVAARVPLDVVCAFLDIPDEDRPSIVTWSTDAFCAGSAEERSLAHLQILDYFTDLVEQRRAEPGDDLVSTLATLRLDGEPLPLEDVVLNCDNLLVGGTENVRLAMSGGMLALLEHPEQWAALRADFDALAPAAVEEILRWTSSATHLLRRATRDVLVGGQTVRAGELVVCWLTSAARDGAQFDSPDTFDLRRTPNRHLALGAGPHYCVGTQLAKLEILAVLREFCAQVESVELAGEPEYLDSIVVNGLRRLPLRLS